MLKNSFREECIGGVKVSVQVKRELIYRIRFMVVTVHKE